jgi:hypothetical protein
MVLKKYKHITFPTNPTFVQAPESLISSSSGLVTRWEDQSGNNNHSLPIAGTLKTSNQNSLQGLLPLTSSVMRRAITINPQSGTTAILVQRNCDLKTIPGTNYLMYFSNLGTTITHAIYAVDSQYGINYSGSTITTGAYSGIGKYLFIIIRHNAGAVNYFINNTSTNSTIVKTSTPSYISEPYYFYDVNDTGSQAGYIQNFKAYWNRELTDSECLELSKYVFMMSNGAVGDNPSLGPSYAIKSAIPQDKYLHISSDAVRTNSSGFIDKIYDLSSYNLSPASYSSTSFKQLDSNSIKGITPVASLADGIKYNITDASFESAFSIHMLFTPTEALNFQYLCSFYQIAAVLNHSVYTYSDGILYMQSTLNCSPHGKKGEAMHVKITYTAPNCKMSCNGVETANMTVAAGSRPTSAGIQLRFIQGVTTGCLHEAIVYNRVTTAAEDILIGNYFYMKSNGLAGIMPQNTALISKKQAELELI